jgi:hypothetical protein
MRLSASAASTLACSRSRPMKLVRVAGTPISGPPPPAGRGRSAATGASSASSRRSAAPNLRSSEET